MFSLASSRLNGSHASSRSAGNTGRALRHRVGIESVRRQAWPALTRAAIRGFGDRMIERGFWPVISSRSSTTWGSKSGPLSCWHPPASLVACRNRAWRGVLSSIAFSSLFWKPSSGSRYILPVLGPFLRLVLIAGDQARRGIHLRQGMAAVGKIGQVALASPGSASMLVEVAQDLADLWSCIRSTIGAGRRDEDPVIAVRPSSRIER